jgi:hypothetical protein
VARNARSWATVQTVPGSWAWAGGRLTRSTGSLCGDLVHDHGVAERFPEHGVQVGHGGDGERLAVAAPAGQQVAVELGDRGRPDGRDLQVADPGRDVGLQASPVVAAAVQPGDSPLRGGPLRSRPSGVGPTDAAAGLARHPGDRPPAVPAVPPRCPARQHHGQAVNVTPSSPVSGRVSQAGHRNATHFPGWPLQRQGHPEIVSNRFADTISGIHP